MARAAGNWGTYTGWRLHLAESGCGELQRSMPAPESDTHFDGLSI
jgi:hypothetical protein